MSNTATTEIRRVETELLQVYDFCPPTRTAFASQQAWREYRDFWGRFFTSLAVAPGRFAGGRASGAGRARRGRFSPPRALGPPPLPVDARVAGRHGEERAVLSQRRELGVRLVRSARLSFALAARHPPVAGRARPDASGVRAVDRS